MSVYMHMYIYIFCVYSHVGGGEIAKLCNNLALAISMIGTSEAMALGVRLGMDPLILANVMNTSTAR